MLKLKFSDNIEAGCDEAGRGCIAGPVVAAAVILPDDFKNEILNDSKQISEKNRNILRQIIEKEALAWAVAYVDNNVIDKINILNASILAMHKALDKLTLTPEFISVDGNKFKQYKEITHQTIVKGDGKYMNIAAASILAKTHRDEYMCDLSKDFPDYQWAQNKGYPTPKHKAFTLSNGYTKYHRKTFNITKQLKLF